MNFYTIIGSMLILIGFGMMIAKWLFGFGDIGAWTLVPLMSGLIFNWLGRRNGVRRNG